jgi:hypothetical protein
VGLLLVSGRENSLLDPIEDMVADYQAGLLNEGLDPEINIKWGEIDISSGGSQDLGMTDQEWSSTITFSIENNGEGQLTLPDTPAVVLTGNAKYSVTSQPAATISAGSSTLFTVQFAPGGDSGTEEVTVSINNNDPDEGAYTFTLTINADKYEGKKAIDTAGDVREYSSIGVYQANVYISYYDVFNQDLKLAVSPNGGFDWTTLIVDSAGDVGQYCSLCVRENKLYISYYDVTNQNLKLAQSPDGGQNWNIETVDNSTDVGKYSSIDVSDSDEIFISYYDQDQEALKLAKYWFGGSGWEWGINERHDPASAKAGMYSSIDESAGIAYISYYYYTSSQRDLYLRFDVYLDKATDTATTDDGYWSSIVVDGSTVYISYFSWVNQGALWGKITLAKSINGGFDWSNIDVDPCNAIFSSADSTLGFTSLAVDGNNWFISYCGEAGASPADPLRFAKSDDGGSSCALTTIDNSIDKAGYYTSIVVNGTDGSNVYISYHDEGNDNLKFAKSADGGSSW